MSPQGARMQVFISDSSVKLAAKGARRQREHPIQEKKLDRPKDEHDHSARTLICGGGMMTA